MSPDELAVARSHVETCDACRTDLKEVTSVGEEINRMIATTSYHQDGMTSARRSLRSMLEEEEDESSPGSRWTRWMAAKMTPAYIGGVAGMLAVAAVLFLLPNPGKSNAEMEASLPNHALTPGMTHTVNLEDVCSDSDEDLDPAVPPQRREAVFREYGISPDRSAEEFQVDYLISPQLGGTDDVRNLWPQSYKETTWNAEAKDALERHLYQLVCERKISLAEAQHDIATNWITAYRKYF